MIIKSELNKTIAHLRDTRMAIWGRGGDIDLTCGLKDLPDAIWSIPADASLAYQEDNSVAYEKIVPAKAEEYAYLSKIGCLTKQNNNLCIADGVYELNNDVFVTFDLGELEAGEYTFYFVGNFTGMACVSLSGNSYVEEPFFYGNPNRNFAVYVNEKEHAIVRLYSEFGDCDQSLPENQDLPCLNGTITGIMLCKASDFDKSYKPYQKPYNFCIADGHYVLSNRPATYEGQVLILDLGELKEGIYQIKPYGNFDNMADIGSDGNHVVSDYIMPDDNQRIFGVTKACNVSVGFVSVCAYDNMYDSPEMYPDYENSCWSGEITGIMLVKLSDTCSGLEDVENTEPITDLEYVPYTPHTPFFYIKPTSIESRGAQLFDESQITIFYNSSNDASPTFGEIVKNAEGDYDYIRVKRGGYAGLCYWGDFSMHLTPGEYIVSSDVYLNSNIGHDTTVTVGLRSKAKKGGGTYTKFYYPDDYDKWIRISSKVTITEEDDYYCRGECSGHAGNYNNLDARFKNIQVQRGENATEFHPFSAEPIDTLEIPEAIRNLPGYGIGKSASECNYIDLARKVFANEYEVVDGDVQKRENPIETDLTQLLPNASPFLKVEGGGSIVFNNEHKQAVPSKIKYVKRTE